MNLSLEKIKFGVIGTNSITDWFLSGALLHPNFELTAVYSRTRERGEVFAQKYGVTAVFTELVPMADVIDAVYIASPNACHYEQTLFFLERGIHVLCEKPLASNAGQARKMVETAKKNGVLLMEAMISTLNPNFLALRENLAKAGKIRKYFSSYCQYSSRYDKYKQGIVENAFKPELSNGALMDIGIYTIYPMVVLFGMPDWIQATGTLLESGVDGSGTVIFRYKGGLEATVMYSKISSSFLGTEVQGEEGTFALEKINIPRTLTFLTRDGKKEDLSAKHCGNDYYYEVKDFIELIQAGKLEHAVNSHANALAVMDILDKVRSQIGLVYPADNF